MLDVLIPGEDAVRQHLAPLIGRTVDLKREFHMVPLHTALELGLVPRTSMLSVGGKDAAVLDIVMTNPDAPVEVPSHAPLDLGPNTILLEAKMDGSARTIQSVPVAAFTEMFGALFAAGKPSVAAFVAVCDATPGCRGYCRFADEWQKQGALS